MASARKLSLPTQHEQMQLQNTDALLRSNLLGLQVDELLSEVCSQKEFEKKRVQAWLRDVLAVLRAPSGVPREITPSWVRKTLGAACADSLSAENTILATGAAVSFAAPTAVEVVGSHSLKTSTAPLYNIDVAVQMPSSSFDARDILNHVYFVKRKLYLLALWHCLEQANVAVISAALFKGDGRKPVLVLRPSAFKSQVSIRLIPTAPTDVFKLSQLRAGKNNVRPEAWLRALGEGNSRERGMDASTLRPTPIYNLAILEDVAVLMQHRILTLALSTCAPARETVVLFKVWLTQRSMRFALESIDSHYASLLVAYLVQTKRIMGQMNPLSAFQVLLRFLADGDLQKRTYDFMSASFGAVGEGLDDEGKGGLVLMHPLTDPTTQPPQVFHFNCLWRVSASALDALSAEARQSVQISSAESSAFSKIFMTKSSFQDRHDVFFHVPYSESALEHELKGVEMPKRRSKEGGAQHGDVYAETLAEMKESLCNQTVGQFLTAKVTSTLEKALGNRTLAVRVMLSPAQGGGDSAEGVFRPQWREKSLSTSEMWHLTVGIILDKDSSYRKVDRGPAADDEQEGRKFRTFWGPLKSKLRRFQDGSIVEAVIWDESKHPAKTACVPRGERIVEEIVRYILARHVPHPCGDKPGQVICKAANLERHFLPAPGILDLESETSADPDGQRDHLDADTLCRKAIECLDALRTILTSKLKDLPLMLESVMAACPELRYTALVPPQTHPLLLDKEGLKKHSGSTFSLVVAPLLITARVEAGGRWPSDKEAILNVKSALLLRIGELLAAQFHMQSVPHQESLDILSGGFIFRLNLLASPEIERLQHPLDSNVAFARRTSIDFAHHNAVKSLHAQHPSFGNAVRLLSRWCAGNYFSGLLSVPVLELLVASVYLDPEYGVAPSSPSAGFRRALLKLASHDWENLPLLVDFAADLVLADRLKISAHFQYARKNAGPDMFIVSSLCREQDFFPVYTEASPTTIVLRMMAAAAERSYQQLAAWVSDAKCGDDQDVDGIMDSPAPPANVILRFCKSIVASKNGQNQQLQQHHPRKLWESLRNGPSFARLKVFSNLSAKETAYNNLVVRPSESPHPLQEEILDTLRRNYGDVALFFWHGLQGRDVYVVWRPAAFLPKPWKVTLATNRMPLSGDGSHSVVATSEIVLTLLGCGGGLFDDPIFL